ncbi:MAG TPA: glutamine synthetase family protein [Candidatus Eisenbacteria bacterium]|nr:glutamine synthetase family protein [Candidatus Eisenbacteria bacterium]
MSKKFSKAKRASRLSVRESKEFVLKKAQDNNVRFIRLWFSDILGQLKSFAITIDELEEVMEEGAGFDGSAIEGFARSDEADMRALPDPSTFEILPWRPRENAVARMFVDIVDVNGHPFVGDPRQCLKRNLKKASDLGYTFYVGPEMEFFYFKDSESTQTLDKGGYFDLTPLDVASDLRRETVLTLEEMGIGVESSHHEVAPSQHEIDLRYTDALTMADNAITYRLVVKEIALKNGFYATFMPKPLKGENGSGMHTHQSLFKGDQNAFYDGSDRAHLSRVAKHYIAGLLRHAREICLVTNQWVNSYKRLTPGYEAPVDVGWTKKNPFALVRVPSYKPGHEKSMRVELRSPDAACNPYLAFSVMLAAGLEGIKHQYALPDAVEHTLSESEKRKKGGERLPYSLGEAIAIAEESKFLKDALGEHIFHSLIENKKIEWAKYCAEITNYELEKYLPIL